MLLIHVLCATNFSSLSKRFKIFLNWVVGPLLFIWLTASIYRQIIKHDNLQQAWQSINSSIANGQWTWLLLGFVLVLPNIGFEARKWQILIRHVEPISFLRAYKSVLTGQSIGINSFNRVGDSLGRILYLHEGHRLQGIALTIVAGISAQIIAAMMGLLGLIFFKYTEAAGAKLQGLSALWFNGLLYVLGAGIIVGFIFYYNISLVTRLVERISFVKKYRFLIQKVEELRSKELTSVLLLSAYRFVVYAVQYICMMKAFGVEAGLAEAAAAVMVMNFILSILPSISIAELGIRGQVGLQVLGLVSTNLTGVLATSVTIWLVNLMLPALAGSIFILGIRLFKKN